MDETADQWRDGGDGERQKDTETREAEVVDGITPPAAEMIIHHKGAADKHKFNTFGYHRRTKQKVVTDFTTVSKGASSVAKPRTALRQVLFSQGASEKNPMPEERGQLDLLKQALEAYPVPVSLKWRWEEESHGTTLEKNWTDIVHSHLMMSKIQRHQQEALWEFVHTELTYINKLTVIKDLVIAALINLHQHGFLLEVTPELLFSNLPSILRAHHLFWQEVIYPMLQDVRRTGRPFDPMRLEGGCLQFQKRFSSYLPYCWEEENTLEFTRRQMDTSPHFLTYVQWVETHPQCERMRLGDMQAKPHQRITKYPLLLKAVLKTTQDPDAQCRLKGMLSSVNVFLESINDYLRLKDEELALSISAKRVEGYEVEGINEEIDKYVREICQFDLTCPIRGVGSGVIRKLLLEENLKIRGRKDSKLEVVALLFSDVLLMTKVQKKGERLKVVRPPLALDRTSCVTLKDGCSFVLVEVGELGCAMNVYIFVTTTAESCSTWVSTIHQAQQRKFRDNRSKSMHEGFADVDYESTPADTSLSPYREYQATDSMERPEFQRLPGSRGRSLRRDSDSQSVDEETRRSSWYSQSGEQEPVQEAWRFSRKLKSPKLRRRRPISSHQGPHIHMSSPGSQGSRTTWSGPNTNSSSNSDSDCNQKLKVNSASRDQSSDSHRVLRLRSLKMNQGMFWNMHDERVSPDPQVFSEPELLDQNFHNKRPKLKAHRSASIPDVIIQGGHGLHPSSNRMSSAVPRRDVAQVRVSRLEGLLERAKGRVRDGEGVKRERRSWNPSPSPSFSTTPSPSPSDGDRETEWDEVELMRSRAPTVSNGWREQLVDGDEEEKKYSPVFTDGVNVDWPGWCFDDDEVMDHLNPEDSSIVDEGLLDGISRTLTSWDFHGIAEHEDVEFSQV
ncbi:uncharacterized protein plekhg6 [Diretmus argenteus]